MSGKRLNPVLQIDPEFESKIPPLTEDEYKQLEENIVAEGVIISPLVVWNDTIIDGHNRYKIAQAHPSVVYTVHEMEFENRYEALVWICKNQLGRRNLTLIQKQMLIGDQYNAEKQAEFYCGNQYTLPGKRGLGRNGPAQKRHGTRTRIAEENGVSESAVKRYAQYSKGATAGEEVSPGFRQDVLSGKLKPTQKDMQAIARASPEERSSVMDMIFHRVKTKPTKEALDSIQRISDDLAKDKPPQTVQSAVQQFEWQVTMMLQDLDSYLDQWPQLLTDELCHKQVAATLQDLKKYILHIEGGTRYVWDYEARKIV